MNQEKWDFLKKQAGKLVQNKKSQILRDRRKRRPKDAKRDWSRDGGW